MVTESPPKNYKIDQKLKKNKSGASNTFFTKVSLTSQSFYTKKIRVNLHNYKTLKLNLLLIDNTED